jgi:ribosomal protein S18 acetylase RimI-like enzyme
MAGKLVGSSEITFRDAAPSDVEQLERVIQLAYRGGKASVDWKNEHTQVTGPRTTVGDLQQLLRCESAHILVAEMEDGNGRSIAGCVLIEEDDDDCIIGMLAVDPGRQNLGLGRLLVRAAEQHAVSKLGYKAAKMWVLGGRDELLAWYKRLGYEATGETRPFFGPEAGVIPTDPNAHFVVIAKALTV